MIKLGVNIDHVATIRQARQTSEPDPVWAAAMAELGGADQITVHLREDRRHIQDRDLELLIQTVNVTLNLECACESEVLEIACTLRPGQVCLVPENRQEVTTEGGLDVLANRPKVEAAVRKLRGVGIFVSLFLDPQRKQIELAREVGGQAVELHTGSYAHARTAAAKKKELDRLVEAGRLVVSRGMRLDAGHGLTYSNVQSIAGIPDLAELNIGHSIVSRSIFVGMTQAVREMKELIFRAHAHRAMIAD